MSHMFTGVFVFTTDYPSENISHSAEDETVTLSFSSPLPLGSGLLSLDFTGELNDKLKGFYRCKYTGKDGEEKFCAVTHFEVIINNTCIKVLYCRGVSLDAHFKKKISENSLNPI